MLRDAKSIGHITLTVKRIDIISTGDLPKWNHTKNMFDGEVIVFKLPQ